MGRRITFSVEAWSPAPRAAVYALLRDGATWPRWSPIGSFRLEREGAEGGESLGAIRVFRTGTVHSREELLALEPDRRLAYTALSGLPMRNHEASVELADRDAGTVITWTESFEGRGPGVGFLIRLMLRGFVTRCVDGLARYAASPATTPVS
jgi:uncharacterized protein YndB with AHSA1/START domain